MWTVWVHFCVCVCVTGCECVRLLPRQCPPDCCCSSCRLLVTNRHHSVFVIHCPAFIITRRNNQVFMFVITPDFKQNILLYFLSVVFICSQRSYHFYFYFFVIACPYNLRTIYVLSKAFFSLSLIASFNPIIEMLDEIPVPLSCWKKNKKKTHANHMLYRNISSTIFHQIKQLCTGEVDRKPRKRRRLRCNHEDAPTQTVAPRPRNHLLSSRLSPYLP